jgi:hypothetical protein
MRIFIMAVGNVKPIRDSGEVPVRGGKVMEAVRALKERTPLGIFEAACQTFAIKVAQLKGVNWVSARKADDEGVDIWVDTGVYDLHLIGQLADALIETLDEHEELLCDHLFGPIQQMPDGAVVLYRKDE